MYHPVKIVVPPKADKRHNHEMLTTFKKNALRSIAGITPIASI
jgi:hypothetical protein